MLTANSLNQVNTLLQQQLTSDKNNIPVNNMQAVLYSSRQDIVGVAHLGAEL